MSAARSGRRAAERARTAELVLGPLGAARRMVVWWSLGMGALVLVTVAFWPTFRASNELGALISQMPSAMVEALGMQDFGTPVGYLRGNLYAVFVPLLLILSAVGIINALLVSEEAAGRLELYLAQPVARRPLFLGRATAGLVGLAVIAAATLAFQVAADRAVGLEIDGGRLAATLTLCFLLAALHGGLALLVGGLRARPSLVWGVVVAAAIGGYVVVALFPLHDTLRPWRHLSPWDWALGGDPLAHSTEPWRYLVLVAGAAILTAVGTWAFGRRDVEAG